ncbi:hypothetical protein [Actinomadura kijaniata]|uniref:hypothetical protein n=1 Tax=Actinomadura kijaniata TaxID=46161 RepID=UPI0008358D8B|nr:hypothetical protein [Actinomadura kijaniata]
MNFTARTLSGTSRVAALAIAGAAAAAALGYAGTASADPGPIPAWKCEKAGGTVIPIGDDFVCYGGYFNGEPVYKDHKHYKDHKDHKDHDKH